MSGFNLDATQQAVDSTPVSSSRRAYTKTVEGRTMPQAFWSTLRLWRVSFFEASKGQGKSKVRMDWARFSIQAAGVLDNSRTGEPISGHNGGVTNINSDSSGWLGDSIDPTVYIYLACMVGAIESVERPEGSHYHVIDGKVLAESLQLDGAGVPTEGTPDHIADFIGAYLEAKRQQVEFNEKCAGYVAGNLSGLIGS